MNIRSVDTELLQAEADMTELKSRFTQRCERG